MGLRKEFLLVAAAATAIVILVFVFGLPFRPLIGEVKAANCSTDLSQSEIILPQPQYKGLSVEEAISKRRSVRDFGDQPLTKQELSQLLWAGQGITDPNGARAAPSAGGLYPIELYVVPNRVEGIGCGIYHYVPQGHKLVLFKEGNFSDAVYRAGLSQNALKDAAAVIVFSAVRERTAKKYGDTSDRFIAIEAGHISENILLESVSLGLGAVPIGGFDQTGMDKAIGINGTGESAIYLNAIGKCVVLN